MDSDKGQSFAQNQPASADGPASRELLVVLVCDLDICLDADLSEEQQQQHTHSAPHVAGMVRWFGLKGVWRRRATKAVRADPAGADETISMWNQMDAEQRDAVRNPPGFLLWYLEHETTGERVEVEARYSAGQGRYRRR